MNTLVKVIETGELLSVWSDNTDEKTYSCLPIESARTVGRDEECSWIGDLVELKYDEVKIFTYDDLTLEIMSEK
jgi:hypothetical protein